MNLPNLTKFQINNNDFITNIRHDPQTESMLFIHQQPIVEVVLNPLINRNYQLRFQSNIYDALVINNNLIVSNKNMPLRIYPTEDQSSQRICKASIYDRKKNSEMFLTPLQMAQNRGRLLGGGKKFVSEYDLGKLTAKQIKQMNNKYISSIQFVQENLVATGSFTGDIHLLDLQSGQIVESIKPHMDLVSRVKKVPQSDYKFVSLARKDNVCYSWDLRNMKTYLTYFEHPLFGNQRTGLQITQDGNLLLLGSEHGEIYVHGLSENEKNEKIDLGVNKCVGSISCTSEATFCAVGERQFALEGEQRQPNYVFSFSGYF